MLKHNINSIHELANSNCILEIRNEINERTSINLHAVLIDTLNRRGNSYCIEHVNYEAVASRVRLQLTD